LKLRRLLSAAAVRPLLLASAACLVLAGASADALAQERAAGTQAPPPSPRTNGATADEDFELNIDTRRISEGDFHAETAVEADGVRGLLLRVGVALSASDIEVLLHGVRGRVRFRASLAPVLRLLDARRAPAPAQVTPTPP